MGGTKRSKSLVQAEVITRHHPPPLPGEVQRQIRAGVRLYAQLEVGLEKINRWGGHPTEGGAHPKEGI